MFRTLRRFRVRYPTLFLVLRLLTPVALTILVLLSLASALTLYSVVRPEKTFEVIEPSEYHLFSSPFTWKGARNEEMSGWYFRGSNQAPLIILCHGYGTNRTELLSLASRLKDNGYNIFLYNLRGHSSSPQRLCTLGILEAEDFRKALEQLLHLPEVDPNRVGVYGASLGAYVALSGSKSSPQVRAMVLDSLYSSVDNFMDVRVEKVVGLETGLLSGAVSLLYSAYFRIPTSEVSAVFHPADFQDKAMLFITGRDHGSLPFARQTRDFYAAFPGKKDILTLSNARESILFGDEKNRYEQNVVEFFRRELPLAAGTDKIQVENPTR